MSKIMDSIEKTALVQPLVSLIQFGSNARLKPLLIDQLTGKLIIVTYNNRFDNSFVRLQDNPLD